MRYAIAFVLLALAASGAARACEAPKPGYGMTHDELIGTANTIVLVRLSSRSSLPEQRMVRYSLKTVELIKGRAEPAYEFLSHDFDNSDNDFSRHRAKEFWNENIGRSTLFCCICGPDHGFRAGRLYLYFPDKLGAMKSAELVADDSDEWLQYVRSKVKTKSRR